MPTRPRAPRVIERLPEQFFTRILAAAAAAREIGPPAPRFIDLGRGNPDLPPPPHAIEALRAAALETDTPVMHGYPPFQGHAALKQAIVERYAADHGVQLDPDREVAVIPGTKTGIMFACVAAADEGDAIALPDPGYPDYYSGIALAGARLATLPLDPSTHWQPDLDALATDPALLVLNYPSNPCAACERPGTFEAAVARAHARGGWLLHDLAYGFLAFDGHRGRSVLEVEGAKEVAVELWSPSKIYGMAGWRIGFMVGNRELIGRVQALVDHTTAGVWTGLQRGLAAALTGDQSHVAQRHAVYRDRRDRLVAALGDAIDPPEGSFYAWWRLPDGITPERLIGEQRVGVAPGEGFGTRGAGYARLSLALPDDQLDEAIARLAVMLGG